MKLTPIKSIIIIIAVGFIVYLNALSGAILSGDDSLIVNSKSATQLNFDSLMSFMDSLTHDLMGVDPFGYHLTNVVLHLGTCVLLFYFLRIFFPIDASLFGVLLFTVLPIHTENVTWISGKAHLLIGLEFLSVFLLFYKKKYLWAFLIFLLSIYPGDKNINIVNLWTGLIPVFLAIYLLVERKFKELFKIIPYFGIFAIIILLYFSTITQRIAYTAPGYRNEVNLWTEFIYSTFSHLWLMIYPVNLVLYHENVFVRFNSLVWGTVIIILLGGFSVYIYKKSKPIFLGLVLFFLFLSPTYSPFPIGWVIAERYAYTPSILLSILLAWIVAKNYRYTIPICLIILSLYAVRTIDRNADYKTDERFWRATVKSNPFSPKARNDMGVMYARESNVIKALQEFKNALRIKPDFKDAQNNLDLVKKALAGTIKIKY